MYPQPVMYRLGLRGAQQIRSPVIRSALQRRFASTEGKLTGPADNAFNRERQAVKNHAAATSGELSISRLKCVLRERTDLEVVQAFGEDYQSSTFLGDVGMKQWDLRLPAS
jgi:hypothetical protein